MRDLNDLKQAGYSNLLALANDIDDAGVITGRAVDGSGIRYAFVAQPSPR